MVEHEKKKALCMHSKGMNALHWRGLLMVMTIKKNNNKKARNHPLQHPSKKII